MWTGWPTFPMVFVKGTLIGGADELEALVERRRAEAHARRMTRPATPPARRSIRRALRCPVARWRAGTLRRPVTARAAPDVGTAPLADCHVAGIRNGVLCGCCQRPLDPAQPEGTQITVRYVVVPAMARRKLADPVFLLAGGPGQSAIAVAATTMPLFARLNNRRDIVFVDQRGTGGSAPLQCDDPEHETLAEQSDPDRQLQAGRCSARRRC